MFLCSYDLGSCSCVLATWVHLLVYFYSNLMYFYVLNFVFVFIFFNFVKINIYILKLDADIDVDMIFIIIIILPRQHLACHKCTLFATSDFFVTGLMAETKIKMNF